MTMFSQFWLAFYPDKRQTDRQADGNGRPIFSYFWGHYTSKKNESSQSSNGVDCNTSLAYAREVKSLGMAAVHL